MKRIIGVALVTVFYICSVANAELIPIGTANYQGSDYNLIHMEDGPFGPITWLDYTKGPEDWDSQIAWVSGLGSELTVTLNHGYTTSINWEEGWRLPETIEGPNTFSYDGTTAMGYNSTLEIR